MSVVQTRNKKYGVRHSSLCADCRRHADDWAGASCSQPTGDDSR